MLTQKDSPNKTVNSDAFFVSCAHYKCAGYDWRSVNEEKYRMRIITISICLLACIFLVPTSHAAGDQNVYYGFFPSEKGIDHKKFVHNIFGFSVDIPSTWVFGVNGTPPTAVVFLYCEGMDTGKLSKEYETIEIGQIPFEGVTLAEAQETVMRGVRVKHPKLTIVQKTAEGKLNGLPSISWIYDWPSKSGYTVTEYITLVDSPSGMRSLAVRTTRRDYSARMNFWNGILETFQPFKPKY